MIYLAKPQLCVDFQNLEKANSLYSSSLVRNERRARGATGCAILYQCMTQSSISRAKKMVAYARFTVRRSRIEVSLSCYAEQSPVSTYRRSELINSQSDYWVVGYTELVMETTVFVLFDVYDSYCI